MEVLARRFVSGLQKGLLHRVLVKNMWTDATDGLTEARMLAITESNAICQLALSPRVIVSQSAAGVLREQVNVLRVFVYRNEESCLKHSVDMYGEDSPRASTHLKQDVLPTSSRV